MIAFHFPFSKKEFSQEDAIFPFQQLAIVLFMMRTRLEIPAGCAWYFEISDYMLLFRVLSFHIVF